MRKHSLLVILIFLSFSGFSQVFPVEAGLSWLPPYSVFPSDYFKTGGGNINVTATLKDLSEPSWPVRLEITLESTAVLVRTKPGYVPDQPAILYPGVAYVFSKSEMEQYFLASNTVTAGVDKTAGMPMKLPEGFYSLCVTVYDYNSNKKLSETVCSGAFLKLGDPPVCVFPSAGNVVNTSEPSLFFQWQQANPVINDPANPLSYSLEIFEITGTVSDPSQALNLNQVLKVYESEPLTTTSYSLPNPSLVFSRGKKYTFRIRAVDQLNQNIIANNGYSEACWFCYGYPTGGNIGLIEPGQGYSFMKNDLPVFRWTAPDNVVSGQELTYRLKIVNFESDSLTAIQTNIPWAEAQIGPTVIHSENVHVTNTMFTALAKYAWQVKAFTQGEEVASSEIRTFTGPPMIDQFYAGNQLVTVTQTFSADAEKFSGKGLVKITSSGTLQELEYHDLRITENSGLYLLESGVISGKVTAVNDIPVNPEDSKNPAGIFVPDSFCLDNQNFRISGHFEMNFPHAVTPGSKAKITATKKWFSYNELKIYGSTAVDDGSYNMTFPSGFNWHIESSSRITFTGNSFALNLIGKTESYRVFAGNQDTMTVRFSNAPNLVYFTSAGELQKGIRLVPETGFCLNPGETVFDFDNGKSPGKFSGNETWKGLYFNNFSIICPLLADLENQLVFDSPFSCTISESQKNQAFAFLDQDGLSCAVLTKINDPPVFFNSFSGVLDSIFFNIENNVLSEGALCGNIQIPFYSISEKFRFRIPLTDNGFYDGYLTNLPENLQFCFNPENENQKINLTVTRAVFQNHCLLDTDISLHWPALNITIENISNLRIWGNGNAGFIVPDGVINLAEQVTGNVGDYEVITRAVGCGRSGKYYSLGLVCGINLGNDVTGPDGQPEINLYSIAENSLLQDDGTEVSVDTSAIDQTNGYEDEIAAIESANEDLNDVQNDLLQSLSSENISMDFSDTASYSTGDEIMTGFPAAQEIASEETDLFEFYGNIEISMPPEFSETLELIRNFSLHLNPAQKSSLETKLKYYKNLLIETTVELLLEPVNTFIDTKAQQLNEMLDTRIQGFNQLACGQIGEKLDVVFSEIQNQLIQALQNDKIEVEAIISEVIASCRNNTAMELCGSVSASVNNNISIPVSSFINENIRDNINIQLKNFVTANAMKFIAGTPADFSPVDFIDSISTGFFDGCFETGKWENCVAGLVSDAIQGINLNNIWNNIKSDVAEKITYYIAQLASQYADEIAALLEAIAGEQLMNLLADNIDLNFDNLGARIASGDLSGILAMDPTNISISSSVVDITGTVNFISDDPVFGDVWRGDMDFFVKVPSAQKGFSIRGIYTSGKNPETEYWFCQVEPGGSSNPGGPITPEAKPLTPPLLLGPVKLMGVCGRLYKHMTDDPGTGIIPDAAVNFGAGLHMVFFDAVNAGHNLRIEAGTTVVVQESGNYDLEFSGNVQAKSPNPQLLTIDNSAVVKGSLDFSYNSESDHFLGLAAVEINNPGLCASADMAVDVKPGEWSLRVGSPENKVVFLPGCTGWAPTGWLNLTQTDAEIGLGLSFSAMARTPNPISIGAYRVTPFAGFYAAAGISAKVQYNPVFRIKEASVWAEAWAGIGADWTRGDDSGTWTLAEAYISGSAGVIFDPKPIKVEGRLAGEITILCISADFEMSFLKQLD
ncbi:MAG: hypothetical protein A2W91_07325 [Bacteroidetes bacterium GWF2_38_335]|nr:MAG: hypothetical protein A2W91_07325 [Bacteroidetes bacterium GWF2_38_335]OFY77139.1 MAG: hypothetical protein A2281_14560 [Bacteroidetes bacterium RIFOXYA12_FULL_38_20]HBS85030.1 hypothetical protein [Bacteroidales bacterium]